MDYPTFSLSHHEPQERNFGHDLGWDTSPPLNKTDFTFGLYDHGHLDPINTIETADLGFENQNYLWPNHHFLGREPLSGPASVDGSATDITPISLDIPGMREHTLSAPPAVLGSSTTDSVGRESSVLRQSSADADATPSGGQSGTSGRSKRMRLTRQQLRFLRSEFAKQPRPTNADIDRLSKVASISGSRIRTWFQNQRSKLNALSSNDRHRVVQMWAVPDSFNNDMAMQSSDSRFSSA
ncbi:hypothetical protein DCS_04655 [Drechmeria coniospora]|uniref:Homeobox domain-containing protein n=1 Tax=Drechmeria coniospora TaxID=98403 RepID=A0A151GKJ6_DRECN|nr:hypothetical protein DCS_04655 [Drechmeria coniospora]KYK57643.1 hypothetical protein DCS_04655 [Drechmeria coniospora]